MKRITYRNYVHTKGNFYRGLIRRHNRNTEPGLYELMTAPLVYGKCKCELGCKCPEAN